MNFGIRCSDRTWFDGRWFLLWLPLFCLTTPASEPKVIYSTGFEVSEGYLTDYTLAGQSGWEGYGSGGNMLVTNFFDGYGQQALVGYLPPEAPKYDTLTLLRPINYVPTNMSQAIIKFSVLMEIVDSTNGEFDYFRWSIYNTEGARLFSLDFDNYTALIFYALDGTNGFVETGFKFDNNEIYELVITMNLARNRWSASMNGLIIVTSQPLTTTNATLSVGDVDAVWAIRRPGNAGDNYMLFDEYRLALEEATSIPPTLETVCSPANGRFHVRLHSEPGLTHVLDASADLANWFPIATNATPSNGVIDFVDSGLADVHLRLYRARQATP